MLAVPIALFSPGCATEDAHHGHDHHAHGHGAHGSAWTTVKQVAATVNPTAGNKCKGVVRFTEVDGTVYVFAEFEGLTPNQQHAMHIHEFGDVSGPDGMKTGGHYNPEGHQHGLPSVAARHAGDLGNVQADGSGKATYRVEVKNISMVGLKNPIIGRSVIVHAKPDDGGQPVGNAGARIGQGVIGIANPPTP
jgi:Cu-Zn family superoxide dismutase